MLWLLWYFCPNLTLDSASPNYIKIIWTFTTTENVFLLTFVTFGGQNQYDQYAMRAGCIHPIWPRVKTGLIKHTRTSQELIPIKKPKQKLQVQPFALATFAI